MAKDSKIEWCDATWNPIVGCSWASPGCDNCYAARMAHRLGRNPVTPQFAGLTGVDQKWTGETRLVRSQLGKPLTWRKGKRIFVCSMGDLFHESVAFAWVDQVIAVMALGPQHTFLVLTKRPERMREYYEYCRESSWDNIRDAINHPDLWGKGNRNGVLEIPLPNVWLGVTAENQAMADERIPILLDTPAAKRPAFHSCLSNGVEFYPTTRTRRLDLDREGSASANTPLAAFWTAASIMCFLMRSNSSPTKSLRFR
ncbi:DUF5131 family protein [Solidesulfovibrio sp.]